MTPKLEDLAAREDFATALNENVCVSANAGAGKTRSIVDRVESLLRSPVPDNDVDPLTRMVVVTYGESAARELRVRSRQRVLESPDSPPAKNFMLRRFNGIFFGTIHSFCLHLLREYGGGRGLPGHFTVLSDRDEWFKARFKQGIDFLALGAPPQRTRMALRYYGIEKIFDLAFNMKPEDVRVCLLIADTSLTPPEIRPLLDYKPSRKVSIPVVERHQRALGHWRRLEDEEAPFLKVPVIDGGGEEFLNLASSILTDYQNGLAECAMVLAAHVAEAFRKFRLERGVLRYEDMIAETSKMCRDVTLLDRIRGAGYRIILDEAQDTDAEMFSILTEITRPVGAEPGTWPLEGDSEGPQPGHFCFVGDDQQCIYAARADIGRYLDYVEAYGRGHGGRRIEFRVTMRCPVQVVELVNNTFPGRLTQSRAVFRQMKASPFKSHTGCGVFRIPFEADEKQSDEDAFAYECAVVAEALQMRGLKGWGCRSWSEVAVLCPRVGWLSVAGRALEAHGIPVAHRSSREVAAENPCYTWPFALFHVLAHPFDRFELIGVLRDLFVIRDADIEEAHRRDPQGLSLFSQRWAKGDLQRALSALETVHREWFGTDRYNQQPNRIPLARMVRRVMGDFGVEKKLAAIGEDVRALARFEYSVEEASRLGKSIWEWLAEERIFLEETPKQDVVTGGVDLISCHKSKGLEWPVVIVLGLWRKMGNVSPTYPVLRRKGSAFQVFADRSTMGSELLENLQTSMEEEAQRLFYVATTRAERLLVISDPAREGMSMSFSTLARWPELRDRVDKLGDGCFSDQPGEGEKDIDQMVAADPEWVQWALQTPRKRLPHDAGRIENEDPYQAGMKDRKQNAMISDPGVGGIDYGMIWHEWVEKVPWAKGLAAIENYVRDSLAELKSDGASPQVLERLNQEARLWLDSREVSAWMDQGALFLSEVPFFWPRDPLNRVEGVVDFLIQLKKGQWLIVDWKTNRQPTGMNREDFDRMLLDTYRGQLELYRDFWRTECGARDVRAALYSTPTASVIWL